MCLQKVSSIYCANCKNTNLGSYIRSWTPCNHSRWHRRALPEPIDNHRGLFNEFSACRFWDVQKTTEIGREGLDVCKECGDGTLYVARTQELDLTSPGVFGSEDEYRGYLDALDYVEDTGRLPGSGDIRMNTPRRPSLAWDVDDDREEVELELQPKPLNVVKKRRLDGDANDSREPLKQADGAVDSNKEEPNMKPTENGSGRGTLVGKHGLKRMGSVLRNVENASP